MGSSPVLRQYLNAVAERKAQGSGLNPHAIAKLEKVVLSMGLGSCLGDRKKIDEAVINLGQIAGQKAVVTKAKKSVSGFRLREGVDVGCCVTLRRAKMYDFLSRVLHVVLPRVRDFRGLSKKGFDGNGNYNFGISEQTVFPEIDPEKITFSQGLNVTVVTTADDDESGLALLQSIGFPFTRD